MNNSYEIERFLSFIRECHDDVMTAKDNEMYANDQTQDILHRLELDGVSYHESAKLAKKLADIRKRRRESKDTYSVLEPIADWCKENPGAIKSIERLLGEVRKREKKLENRMYQNKTDVLEVTEIEKVR